MIGKTQILVPGCANCRVLPLLSEQVVAKMFGPSLTTRDNISAGSRTSQWLRNGPRILHTFCTKLLAGIRDKVPKDGKAYCFLSESSWNETIVKRVLNLVRNDRAQAIIWDTKPHDVKQLFNVAVPVRIRLDHEGNLVPIVITMPTIPGANHKHGISEYPLWFNRMSDEKVIKRDDFFHDLMPGASSPHERMIYVLFGKLLLENGLSSFQSGGPDKFTFAYTLTKLGWITDDIIPGFSYCNFFVGEVEMTKHVQKATKQLGLPKVAKFRGQPNFEDVDISCTIAIREYLEEAGWKSKGSDIRSAAAMWYAIFYPMTWSEWQDILANKVGRQNVVKRFLTVGEAQPSTGVAKLKPMDRLPESVYKSIAEKGVIFKEDLCHIVRSRFFFLLILLKDHPECFPTQTTKTVYERIISKNATTFDPSHHTDKMGQDEDQTSMPETASVSRQTHTVVTASSRITKYAKNDVPGSHKHRSYEQSPSGMKRPHLTCYVVSAVLSFIEDSKLMGLIHSIVLAGDVDVPKQDSALLLQLYGLYLESAKNNREALDSAELRKCFQKVLKRNYDKVSFSDKKEEDAVEYLEILLNCIPETSREAFSFGRQQYYTCEYCRTIACLCRVDTTPFCYLDINDQNKTENVWHLVNEHNEQGTVARKCLKCQRNVNHSSKLIFTTL